MHSQGAKKAGKTNLRERETTAIMKVGVQKEMNLIQKLTDLLLQTAIPNDLSTKSIQQLLSLILEMFFSVRDSE
jgi:type III secretion system FlhB-like substrate exporter